MSNALVLTQKLYEKALYKDFTFPQNKKVRLDTLEKGKNTNGDLI